MSAAETRLVIEQQRDGRCLLLLEQLDGTVSNGWLHAEIIGAIPGSDSGAVLIECLELGLKQKGLPYVRRGTRKG